MEISKLEDHNLGRASQKALRTVPPLRRQGTVIWVFRYRGLYIKWRIIDSLHNPDLSNIDTMHSGGRGEAKRQRRIFLCLNVSCLAIKYEFYFTPLCLPWLQFPFPLWCPSRSPRPDSFHKSHFIDQHCPVKLSERMQIYNIISVLSNMVAMGPASAVSTWNAVPAAEGELPDLGQKKPPGYSVKCAFQINTHSLGHTYTCYRVQTPSVRRTTGQ